MFKLAFVATVAVVGANPIKKVYKAPTKSCPKGYSLEGKKCVSRHFEDEEVVCDIGFLNGGLCESSYAASKVCPAGWTLSNTFGSASLPSVSSKPLPPVPHCLSSSAVPVVLIQPPLSPPSLIIISSSSPVLESRTRLPAAPCDPRLRFRPARCPPPC
eukprot:Selendium_serpulae@DN10809_c0_g1_i1.p1